MPLTFEELRRRVALYRQFAPEGSKCVINLTHVEWMQLKMDRNAFNYLNVASGTAIPFEFYGATVQLKKDA